MLQSPVSGTLDGSEPFVAAYYLKEGYIVGKNMFPLMVVLFLAFIISLVTVI